jgi:hypothetical protein|tara:strand:+ start:7782 stop:7928 length:147 start_codon:yes stop_codon:yes gene_type:complete
MQRTDQQKYQPLGFVLVMLHLEPNMPTWRRNIFDYKRCEYAFSKDMMH